MAEHNTDTFYCVERFDLIRMKQFSVLLLLHAIGAISMPSSATTTTTTTLLKGNEQQRNKKAFNVSQSPITYVKRLESSSLLHHHQPEAKKVVANGGRLKPRTKGKKILENVPQAMRKNIMSNHELLNALGLSKMPSPSNHHRKRLATQSRHVGRPDDSRIFVVKLPPNPYYYSHMGNKIVGVNEPNAIEEKGKKIPVGFKSNGKPAAVYHWNLPVLAKIFSGTDGRSNSKRYKEKKVNLRHTDINVADLIDLKHTPTWTSPSSSSSSSKWQENETLDKSSAFSLNGHDDDERAKILKKKSTPHFYAPLKKQKVSKQFPSNGKPKTFYVMQNSKSDAKSFHNLIE